MDRESTSGERTHSRERGARLQQARKAAGLRQKDVARELCDADLLPNPREQTVSEWERGESDPNLKQLTWMRERYGFDWSWFFSGADPRKELAAYRRIATVVLATEGLSPSPAAGADHTRGVVEEARALDEKAPADQDGTKGKRRA